MSPHRFRFAGLLMLVVITLGADQNADRARDTQALAKLQSYVGQWRGVGQIRRGSTAGAWRETCQWAWQFDQGDARLAFQIDDAKYFQSATLLVGDEPDAFELVAKAKSAEVKYLGRLDAAGTLVLTGVEPVEDQPDRISLRQVAEGNRLIMLFEKRVGDDRFQRLAEVSYTRVGSNFGQGTNYIECIVTGGLGTLPVTHDGKTYYVCCSGCRDHFNADPVAALAEYRERKAQESRKASPEPSPR